MAERDYYTTGEVAKALGVSKPTAIRRSEKGDIPGLHYILDRRRWDKGVFDAFLKRARADQGKIRKRTKRTS